MTGIDGRLVAILGVVAAVLTVIGGVLGLIQVFSEHEPSQTSRQIETPRPTATPRPTITAPNIVTQPVVPNLEGTVGQPLTYATSTGDLSVTVTGVDCTHTTLQLPGSFSQPAIAQGRWCITSIDYTNNGTAPASMFGLAVSSALYDDAGRSYVPDAYASSVAQTNEALARGLSGMLIQVNPGQSASTALAFDVPSDALPARLDLQNGPGAPEVAIQLTGATS